MRELKKKYIYVNQNKEIFGNIKVILTFLLILEAAVQRFSVKKGVLRHFTKFTGKHLCQSPFFNKVAGVKPNKPF